MDRERPAGRPVVIIHRIVRRVVISRTNLWWFMEFQCATLRFNSNRCGGSCVDQ